MSKATDLAFKRGFYLAAALLVREGYESHAVDLLDGFGRFDLDGVDEYDAEVLRPLEPSIKYRKNYRNPVETSGHAATSPAEH